MPTDPKAESDGATRNLPDQRPLNYRDPKDDRPPEQVAVGLALGCAVLAAATVFGLVVIWVVSNLYLGSPSNPQPSLKWRFPAAVTVVAVVGWGWLLYVRRIHRPTFVGLLIGLGIAILIEGVCFSANRW